MITAVEPRLVVEWTAPPASDEFSGSSYTEEERERRVPPGQTLARKFPHLEYASIPKVEDPAAWKLHVFGSCKETKVSPLLDVVRDWPQHELRQDFHCITGWSILDTEWVGVAGRTVFERAVPADHVTSVMLHALDQFTVTLWLEDFLDGLLAYAYRGRPLAPQHGFPLRFIAPPHLWQYKSCKWLTGVEFMVDHRLGFWEKRAYSDSAKVWENDRYANPELVQGKTAGQIRAPFQRKAER